MRCTECGEVILPRQTDTTNLCEFCLEDLTWLEASLTPPEAEYKADLAILVWERTLTTPTDESSQGTPLESLSDDDSN